MSDAVESAALDGTYFLVDAVYQQQQEADDAVVLRATSKGEREVRCPHMLLALGGVLSTFGNTFAELWACARP